MSNDIIHSLTASAHALNEPILKSVLPNLKLDAKFSDAKTGLFEACPRHVQSRDFSGQSSLLIDTLT